MLYKDEEGIEGRIEMIKGWTLEADVAFFLLTLYILFQINIPIL